MWYDSKHFEFLLYYVTQYGFFLDESFVSTWKVCILLFLVGLLYKCKKKNIQLIDFITWFCYILVDFLFPLILLINESRAWITEHWGHIPKSNCGFAYFSFQLRFCFLCFEALILGWTLHIPDFYVFLMNWFYYHHVMSHFIPLHGLYCEFYFVWYQCGSIWTLVFFLLIVVWHNFSHIFTVILPLSL